jgi:sugar phosphate isomerase/epimerase
MQNRRDFLKHTSLAVAAGLLAPNLFSNNGNPVPAGKNIGLQLYSLRDMVGKKGIQAVLEATSKIGYKNLETAGYSDGLIYGMAPKEFRKQVKDLGMKFTSAHLGQSWSKEKAADIWKWWDQAIEAHHEAGAKYMVQPFMPVGQKSKIEDLQMYCEYFSKVGEKVSKAGMAFGYHNHTEEFKKIGEHVIYDYMLANTDPKSVMFELDVYWCHEGGCDPVDYLKKYADRIRLTHIKDAKEIGASGIMDFESIFNQMNAHKMKDWYVEIEEYTTGDPVASAQQSFEFLNRADYVK